MKKRIAMALVFLMVLSMAGCSNSGSKTDGSTASGTTLRIVRQYSIMYAPVYIMEKANLLEKYLPGVTVEWSELGSGAAINEALAANRLDIAFMGTPPAIIAWDKGIEMRILSNLCVSPLGLQVSRPEIASLADFNTSDKIAMPGLGSIQHILLSMACEKELGDAHALDNNLVAMTHPDAAMSMVSGGDLAGHLTALPYIATENEAGFKTLMTGADAFGGDYSTIVAVAALKLHDENPAALAGVLAALNEAMYMINTRDAQAITIIAETEKITEEQALAYLDWEGTNYTTTLYGLEGMIDFMLKEAYISKAPALDELLWEAAHSTIGVRAGETGILEEAQLRR